MTISRRLEDILPLVEKPSRYIGGEVNAVRKDWKACRLTFAFAFPDIYEIGMSHTGLQILYAILNGDPRIAAERVFAPWPDLEQEMRKGDLPLTSLESSMPLHRFDIVGFSLQYELSYTNVLAMLDLGGIPLYSEERRDGDPLVIAGGPSVFNPEPMAPFFDAFVIGEAEEAILELSRIVMEAKEAKTPRDEVLSRLGMIGGVYVPSIHGPEHRIGKRTLTDLNGAPYPAHPVIPVIKTIHDRATLEIARGCTRGCRFCQAGMVWRPTRERSPEKVLDMAEQMLRSTGYDELSLLSLSSGDYSCIEYLLSTLMNRYVEKRIALALPSLRTETLTARLIEEIRRVRKTSFTLAPEAGTQRLRNVINKGNREEDLLATAHRVFNAGWRSMKLYFMIGLPTETMTDLEGIVDLAHKVLRQGGARKQVTVSLSTFIPKPHTPFQWCRQISIDEIEERQEYFKDTMRHRNLNLKWHDKRMSLLEGVLSRGDRKIADLIFEAYSRGCRFDGWSDQIRFERWEEALSATNVDTGRYLGKRDTGAPLPWDHIDCGIEKAFLLAEYEKSQGEALTGDCRFGTCSRCGVCNSHLNVVTCSVPEKSPRNEIRGEESAIPPEGDRDITRKYRFRFAKRGRSRFLSHLETAAALTRGIFRNDLRCVFSEGFHPHPRISFPFATPVGIESHDEYMDVEMHDPGILPHSLIGPINASLPEGLEILDIRENTVNSKQAVSEVAGFEYRIGLPQEEGTENLHEIGERISSFLAGDTWTISRTRKGKETEKDIRPLVKALEFDESNLSVTMTLRLGPSGGVRPMEILTNVLGLGEESAKKAFIVKTDTIFSDRTPTA